MGETSEDSDGNLMSEASDGAGSFSASMAPGSPVLTCSAKSGDCKSLWADYDKQADNIMAPAKGDPIQRNKYISKAYAQMYQSDKNLLWSGTAAFASKQVGCGMASAKKIADQSDQTLTMEQQFQSYDPEGAGPDLFNTARSYSAHTMLDALSTGNASVFKEIYPAMKFYEENGADRLKQCASARQPPLSNDLVNAFQDISKGNNEAGAEKMLKYEQSQTLQHQIYDDHALALILRANSISNKLGLDKSLGTEPVKVSFTSECSGGTEVKYDGNNLANFDSRWPYAKKVADTFTGLTKSDPAGVDASLQKIIDRGQ